MRNHFQKPSYRENRSILKTKLEFQQTVASCNTKKINRASVSKGPHMMMKTNSSFNVPRTTPHLSYVGICVETLSSLQSAIKGIKRRQPSNTAKIKYLCNSIKNAESRDDILKNPSGDF